MGLVPRVLIVAETDDRLGALCQGLDAIGWRTLTARSLSAASAALADYPIVPLHYQNDIYGISKKVSWKPREDYYLTMYDATWK